LHGGRYTSSFLKIRVEQGRVTEEIAPTPYKPGTWDWLRLSATARYLYYRQQDAAAMASVLSPSPAAASHFQANMKIDEVLPHITDIEVAIDYLFGRLSNVARKQNVRLLILMDGDRQAIYQGADGAPLYQIGALALNALAAQAVRRDGVYFLDMYSRYIVNCVVYILCFSF